MMNSRHLRSCSALFFVALFLRVAAASAMEPQIPDQPPLPASFAGRWLEKTAERKGKFTRCWLYVFTAKSEVNVFAMAFDEKAKKWADAKKTFGGGVQDWFGYGKTESPEAVTLTLMPHSIYPVAIPMRMTYQLEGDQLTLTPSFGTLGGKQDDKPGSLVRVQRFPSENPEETAWFDKMIREGRGDGITEFFLMGVREASGHASDDLMVRNFYEHREDFEKLRTMMLADRDVKNVPVKPDAEKKPDTSGLSPERMKEYQDLFRKLDLEDGVSGFGDAKEAHFIASRRGMLNSGSEKEYLWLAEPPDPKTIVPSIDDYLTTVQTKRAASEARTGRVPPNEYFTIYRAIEGNWWLSYNH